MRFLWPDPVLDTLAAIDDEDVWMSHDSPSESIAMTVQDLGAFVRSLLVVDLDDDTTVTFGLWVGVHPEALDRAAELWNSSEYDTLALSGLLANRILPWGCLGAPVDIAVINPEHTPYCVATDDPELSSVLTTSWPPDMILATLPH